MINNSNIFWNSQFSAPTTRLYPTYTSTTQLEGVGIYSKSLKSVPLDFSAALSAAEAQRFQGDRELR